MVTSLGHFNNKQIKCLFIKKKKKWRHLDKITCGAMPRTSAGTSFQRQELILYQKYTSGDKDLSNERYSFKVMIEYLTIQN